MMYTRSDVVSSDAQTLLVRGPQQSNEKPTSTLIQTLTVPTELSCTRTQNPQVVDFARSEIYAECGSAKNVDSVV
jgi:hypothetical protein